jgi:8-oxo-dGTP pyrophosphatase MutT (NUDIX family)
MLQAMKERGAGWKVTASDVVIETPHLRLRRDQIELPNGTLVENYYVRESRGFTIVFALTPDDRVVLVRQYKHGIGQTVLELPAGAVDPGEEPAACARRELGEETGYVADPPELELAGNFVYDPTSSTARYSVFIGRNARLSVATDFDDTEDIEVVLVPIGELREMVRNGTISVGAHVASIYYVLDMLGKL